MQRSIPWGWILLALALLLLPGPAGRLILDLLGGITLTLLALPLLAGGAALIGWQVLKRRIRTCGTCGATSLGSPNCPACGAPLSGSSDGREPNGADPAIWSATGPREIDPRNVTINVDAVDVDGLADKSAGEG
jgi:hypothetical protein